MAHSKPYIEWFWPLNVESEAGWQVQDDQFRLAIRVNKNNGQLIGKGKEKKAERAIFAEKHKDFFDFSDIDDQLDTLATMISEFRHFDPNFVYRYKKVPDLTVSQLTTAAIVVANRTLTQ